MAMSEHQLQTLNDGLNPEQQAWTKKVILKVLRRQAGLGYKGVDYSIVQSRVESDIHANLGYEDYKRVFSAVVPYLNHLLWSLEDEGAIASTRDWGRLVWAVA